MTAATEPTATTQALDDSTEELPVPPEMLFGFWYRALASERVPRRRLIKVTVLDTALVVGRDSGGRAFALIDACPHRGKPLSCGWLHGDVVQCSFHGWQFDARTGRCRFVPACTAAQQERVSKLRAGHVQCEERDGFVWVFLREPGHTWSSSAAKAAPADPPPELPVYSPRYRHFSVSLEVPISADHAIISFMDPAHGPFVHRAWWLLARVLFGVHHSESRVRAEPIPLGFRETAVMPIKEKWSVRLAGSDTTTAEVDFVLPHTRIGRFRFGRYWLSAVVSVTPITADRCRVDQVVAWHALPWLPFVTSLLKLAFWLFLVQDERNLAQQAEGLRRIRRFTLIGDADRAARWYQQIKRAYLEARRKGTAFEHPIRGPVDLHFRNPLVSDIGTRDGANGYVAQGPDRRGGEP